MKTFRVTMPEEMVAALDAAPEVQRGGRSGVVRLAVQAWLLAKAEADLVAAYQRGYGEQPVQPDECADFAAIQVWPEP